MGSSFFHMNESWLVGFCVLFGIVRDEAGVHGGWTLLITDVVTAHSLATRCSHYGGQPATDQAGIAGLMAGRSEGACFGRWRNLFAITPHNHMIYEVQGCHGKSLKTNLGDLCVLATN